MPAEPLPMRALGQARDLDLDFDTSDRPGLVTGLLTACSIDSDSDQWWRQPVGTRTAALLKLVQVTDGIAMLAVRLQCVQQSCAEPFEFELPLSQVLALAPDAAPITLYLPDGRTLQARRPTGEDLRHVRRMRGATRADVVSALLDRVILAGEASIDDETQIAQALADQDALVEFEVHCVCPACGHDQERAVDLEGIALSRLARRQSVLLREVHTLAAHYGWSEDQIMALTPSRRARYLAMIEATS